MSPSLGLLDGALVTSIHHVQQAAVTGRLTMIARCLMLRVGMWTTVLYTVCLYTAMAFDMQHDSLDYRQNMTNVSAAAPQLRLARSHLAGMHRLQA